MEMALLRQDDVAQDMASATNDPSDVRRKYLRPQPHESGYGETEYFILRQHSHEYATAVCNYNCNRASGVISLSVYPSQVQCFKVAFHALLKSECQREITRQRPIHSFGAKVDRGFLASTLFKPGPEFMT